MLRPETTSENARLDNASIQMAANALFDARARLQQIRPLRETHTLLDSNEAYRVQERNTARHLAAGRRLVGRKIGLTSKAVQAQLGVDQPDYGMLWEDLGFKSGEQVPASRFIQPRVEAEIAFVLAKDLTDEMLDLKEVEAALDYALAAVEIVDSAIANWDIRLIDTIADNASAGGYVLGTTPRSLRDVDLRLCGMVLTRNGEPVSLGVGAACLGHPLNAVWWLARKMIEVERPLRAGDLVLSGALGPMIPMRAADHFIAEIQGFAPLIVNVGS